MLASHGIASIDGDVEHDQASMDELVARGLKAVPVTILDDQVVIGFNPTALARMFNLDSPVAVADLPTMLEKYEIVLPAACRACRQLPAERWD